MGRLDPTGVASESYGSDGFPDLVARVAADPQAALEGITAALLAEIQVRLEDPFLRGEISFAGLVRSAELMAKTLRAETPDKPAPPRQINVLQINQGIDALPLERQLEALPQAIEAAVSAGADPAVLRARLKELEEAQ